MDLVASDLLLLGAVLGLGDSVSALLRLIAALFGGGLVALLTATSCTSMFTT